MNVELRPLEVFIVKFHNPHHPEPHEETCDTPGGEYFFRFEKVMK